MIDTSGCSTSASNTDGVTALAVAPTRKRSGQKVIWATTWATTCDRAVSIFPWTPLDKLLQSDQDDTHCGGRRGNSSDSLGRKFWRRERDSNPRCSFCPHTPLAGERLRPLGHLSGIPDPTYCNYLTALPSARRRLAPTIRTPYGVDHSAISPVFRTQLIATTSLLCRVLEGALRQLYERLAALTTRPSLRYYGFAARSRIFRFFANLCNRPVSPKSQSYAPCSSPNALCSTRTANSRYFSSTTTEILISEVEII